MGDSAQETSVSLPDFLTARARASSDSRLVADAIGGLALILTFSLWRIPAWYALVAAGTCFLGYGLWAIAHRELCARDAVSRPARVALRTLSLIAAGLGLAAGIFLILVVLARALGRIIS